MIIECSAEVQDPIVLPQGIDGMANPRFSNFRVEQIRSVRCTMQLTTHHSGRRLLSLSNILGEQPRVLIAERL